ncbi:MAG TPA: outer membrane porin, OprD family, partial [Pseudomonas sp.]|nr:outer membrane porin, OprD family [Pseudomonas sp.]
MTRSPLPPRALLGGAIVLALLPSAHAESAGFFEDSKTSLVLRNYYFNRDFNDPGASKSKIEEWAQGAVLKFNSGYTPGVLGFGLDGIAMLGVKLDSGPQRSGSELLPVHDDGRSADDYGRIGMAAKMRLSATELMLGELMPDIPLLRYDDGRLLPQTFQGTMLVSRELPGLNLQAGQYTAVSL